MCNIEQKFYEYQQDAIRKLKKIGIQPRYVSQWKINTRAKQRWGQCKHLPNGTFEININKDLLEHGSDIAIMDTIIHELLHTCDGCYNHGKEWKRLAAKVNKAYPQYDIKRCTSAAEKGLTVAYNYRRRIDNIKYIVTCDTCRKKWEYYRYCKTIEAIENNRATCPYCGNDIFWIDEL